jgi:hypothetical protein
MLLGFMVSIGCGGKAYESAQQSHTSMDVNVPKEGVVTAEQLKNVNVGLSGFIRNGQYEVDTRELVDSIKIDGPLAEMMPRILETREPTTSLECKDRRCRVISLGEAFSFEARWIDIPLFGTPTIYLDEVINLEMTIAPDTMKAEICRLYGIRAKAGMLDAKVDGLRYELEGDAIKEFLMDTGSGGTYPTSWDVNLLR